MLILSSRMRPKEQFEGYAFVGTDYVHGPAGMTAYRARTGRDPVAEHAEAIAGGWGGAPTRPLAWPLFVHARRTLA